VRPQKKGFASLREYHNNNNNKVIIVGFFLYLFVCPDVVVVVVLIVGVGRRVGRDCGDGQKKIKLNA